MPSLIDLVRGSTFDDFLFTPQYSVVERRGKADPALAFQNGPNAAPSLWPADGPGRYARSPIVAEPAAC